MVTILPASASDIDTLRAIDDDACALYAAHGVEVELPHDHPFARAELARWLRSAELGSAFLAVDHARAGVGFAALEWVDGAPYLDQLSVRVAAMRQGIGGRLLARAAEWARASGGSALWLTTYAHLSFNQPYYERHGFVVVPESECSAGLRHHLAEQRSILPAPDQRVAMRRPL
ncbi:MAG TPA: GNAT family N-acetyltransferase [Polyangiaceae bacterium]|jgi:GNAT superfamily N-acetyltransferase|nr:GNAT family N-acetyltransferase [Polyangiaceae bacterium]